MMPGDLAFAIWGSGFCGVFSEGHRDNVRVI